MKIVWFILVSLGSLHGYEGQQHFSIKPYLLLFLLLYTRTPYFHALEARKGSCTYGRCMWQAQLTYLISDDESDDKRCHKQRKNDADETNDEREFQSFTGLHFLLFSCSIPTTRYISVTRHSVIPCMPRLLSNKSAVWHMQTLPQAQWYRLLFILGVNAHIKAWPHCRMYACMPHE